MKKISIILTGLVFCLSSCKDFLDLEPEFATNESSFYKTEKDFETAIIGAYSGLQNLHNTSLLYLTELTTDNAEIQWTSPTTSETECDEVNYTIANTFIGSVWSNCFTSISRSNTILSKLDEVELGPDIESRYRGEALFLRAYNYFIMVRLFGKLPLVTSAFSSPTEIGEFDMSRKPVSDIYALIESDLKEAASGLSNTSGLSKSRASAGAAKTLLAKVYLTLGEADLAISELEDVMAMGYSLEDHYADLFSPGNDELDESVFEVKYLSGNVNEGNSFSTIFTPPLFNMAIFPNNMAGSGRINPTEDMADSYEEGDLRRTASIADSTLLITGEYSDNKYGLKFVDFTTGVAGDGGVNYTALRYADVLLMYAEALNNVSRTSEAQTYLNIVRNRADLPGLENLSQSELDLAIENERRHEFFLEGHRWFDLLRTGRTQAVINSYFESKGLTFTVEDFELLMPVPQRELDIDGGLEQNPGY